LKLAVPAQIAQITGQVERVISLDEYGREKTLELAKQIAIDEAIQAGADPKTIEIVNIEDGPLAYLPGNATRV
jgi:hypothetical protein